MSSQEFFIHSAEKGKVIGSKGSKINALKGLGTSVTIDLSDKEEEPSRVTAENDEVVAKVIAGIEEALGHAVSPTPLAVTVLSVPAELVGPKIIGPKGHTIRTLSKDHGCFVQVEDAQVTIAGPSKSVTACHEAVAGLVGAESVTVVSTTAAKAAAVFKPIKLSKVKGQVLFFAPGLPERNADNFDYMVHLLSSATKSLDVAVFGISDNRLARLMIEAHRKGIKVRVLTDAETEHNTGSDVAELAAAGIPVIVDRGEGLMHHKFAILDQKIVITGSFNWSDSAHSKNCENIEVRTSSPIIKGFVAEFERLVAARSGKGK